MTLTNISCHQKPCSPSFKHYSLPNKVTLMVNAAQSTSQVWKKVVSRYKGRQKFITRTSGELTVSSLIFFLQTCILY